MLKFLCGIALGFAVGLIIAPAPGEDTRRQIVDKAQDLAQAPQRKANELLDQVPERAAQVASDAARQAAEQAVGKVREKTGLPETGTGR
jgi:gas vesicle protein